MADRTVDSAVAAPEAPARRGIRYIYYGYWLVVAGFIAQFIAVGAQNYVFGVFVTPMTEEFGWGRSEFVLARTFGQIVMAMTGFIIGAQIDRHGGRRLMRIGIVILFAAMFATSYVQTLWQWWLLNGLILSVGAAMIGNLVVNVTLSKWFVERRGRMVGFASMGVSFAGIAITPFAAFLVDAFGWRDAWRVLALCALLIIVPLSFLIRRAPEDYGLHPDGKSDEEVAQGGGEAAARDFASSLTRGEALRTSAFYMVVVAFGLAMIAISVMLVHTIPFMEDAGHSTPFAAFMITVASIPALLLKPVWGYFIDKADVQKISLIGFALNAIALTTIVFSVRAGTEPAIILGFFLLGCGWSGFIPLQEVVWGTFFGRRYLGAVRGAGLPFSLALGAGAPLFTAYYFDTVGNYDAAFLTIAALSIVGGTILQFARRPTRERSSAVT